MVEFSKVANGVARSGLLFTGLLGVYLSNKQRMPGYMAYVSWYIACIGLAALAHYLIEDEYKESDDKDKDSRTPAIQKDMAKNLGTKQISMTENKISPEEFDKEADKVLLKIKNTASANVPTKIRLPNLEHVDPKTIENSDFSKLVELGRAKKDYITLRTSPIKMQVLDVNGQNLDHDAERPLIAFAGDIIDELRLRQITREPE